MISNFYKDHPEKSIVILPPIDFIPPMAKLTAKSMAKQLNTIKKKRG